jgi:hypothetical protein
MVHERERLAEDVLRRWELSHAGEHAEDKFVLGPSLVGVEHETLWGIYEMKSGTTQVAGQLDPEMTTHGLTTLLSAFIRKATPVSLSERVEQVEFELQQLKKEMQVVRDAQAEALRLDRQFETELQALGGERPAEDGELQGFDFTGAAEALG